MSQQWLAGFLGFSLVGAKIKARLNVSLLVTLSFEEERRGLSEKHENHCCTRENSSNGNTSSS